MKKVLAIDMGATSIRGIIGYIENNSLVTKEVMRMPHKIIHQDNRLRWQWNKLLDRIVDTICSSKNEISSVGIDTWGVDFGLLNQKGDLTENPISYRDPEHISGYKFATKKMSARDLFLHTGNQIMPINTLYQLIAIKEFYQNKWSESRKMLLMPDLIGYFLTGQEAAEETIFSTTQLYDLNIRQISEDVLSTFNIGKDMIPNIVKAGTIIGNTKDSRLEALRDSDVSVIAVCGHDTASAVLLTKAFYDSNCLFLSCGTWSLLGGLTDKAIINDKAFEKSLTNELGYASKNMFFKNITGLYLLEKYRNEMNIIPSFDEITNYVGEDKDPCGIIDLDDPSFAQEEGSAKNAIDTYLKKTYQVLPKNNMGYYKVLYESLVRKYVETINDIGSVSGKNYTGLHIIGGGAKSSLLCKMIADKTALPVMAGPFEATALGNIITQLVALGEVPSIEDGVEMAWKGCNLVKY